MNLRSISRKKFLAAFEDCFVRRPLVVFSLDIALFAAAATLTLVSANIPLKVLGSVLMAFGIVRLFMIGHDACHGSLFKHPALNHLFGRIAFLPSLTAFSLWDVGHNVAHHSFNNLKGRDQVWTPFSKEEFDRLSPLRQALERIYRSGLGWGLYYFLELWWRKLYFPSVKEIGSGRIKYKLDSALVTLAAAAWVGTVLLVSRQTDQGFWTLSAYCIVAPFALWNVIMGFVVYVHHTHPQIAWFQNRQHWQRASAYLTSTANVRLPFGIDRLMHNIMEHNAHHLNPRIPMISLHGAQRLLQEQCTDQFTAYQMTWRAYKDCVQRCKLYDYVNHTWLDWKGVVTARVTFGDCLPQLASGAVAESL